MKDATAPEAAVGWQRQGKSVKGCYRRASSVAPKDGEFVAQQDDFQFLPLV